MREFAELWRGGPVFAAGEFGISTDSVLLADFAPHKAGLCMDLGCGSGLLGVLLLSSAPGMTLHGVEITPDWAQDCRENLRANGMDARSEITTGDLREHRRLFSAGKYDLVVCNPPYFPPGSGGVTKKGALSGARSEETCSVEDVCRAAGFLLKNGGSLCLVHRAERMCGVFAAMTSAGIEPKRLRTVQHRADSAPSVFLVEGRRGGKPGLSVLPALILTDGRGDTEEARRIYHLYQENV